ncbi:uncharacterized protein LOC124939614 [Impatiens glandulifera]|uniref:uncharacterized protein LOC124939614 n=1 Tax=Impatiens glandulifera TaxID=253017 RepID=UPI001FB05D42|nr:uncharacterized protein LOC124939614 [Impatiens glandulifera]
MVTASSPHCVLVIGGISSEAAAASHETTTTVNHSYTKQQTPYLKMMETTTPAAEYNPERIPASVFSNKPSNQTDWSIASNESLFSIGMGPSNSTKDITLNEIKPEEVAISEDSSNSFFSLPALPDDHHNEDMISSSSSSSSSRSSSADEYEDEEVGSESGEMVKPELKKIIVEKTTTEKERVRSSSVSDDDDDNDKETRRSDTARSSNTQLSESSWNSKTSFAFPILTANKQGRQESKNLTIQIPPALITAHKEPQPAAPPQTDVIAADKTRSWFCCSSFKLPIFCCC